MTDIRLSYDALGQRWEGVILPTDQWTQLEDATPLLTIARNARGDLAGFVFDCDVESSEFTSSLRMIADSFGENVRDTVSTASTVDPTGYVLPLAATSLAVRDEQGVFPVLGSVNARARDVSIVEDRPSGIIRVSMRLPWWAAFLRPWVTVRRRGRPELIALGALRRSRGVHTAELHYGLPATSSSLVAEVIRGTRSTWISAMVAAVVTALLIFGGLTLFGSRNSPDATVSSIEVESTTGLPSASTSTSEPAKVATTTSSSTVPSVTTTPETATTLPAVTTSKPPRSSPTTSSTLLPPGGVSFTLPNQYITTNDTRADVTVSQTRIQRGGTVNLSVRISGVFINPFDRSGISTLPELIAACRALVGVEVTVPPTPGWSTNVSVSLLGTGATAGGYTQLVVVGNKATECGDVLTSVDPTRINVVRVTYFREVPLNLTIPSNLQPGKYQLVLDAFPFMAFSKTTPLEITVVE